MFQPEEFPQYAQEVRALAERTRSTPRGAVAFYGSSSIRLWPRLKADFPDIPIVNLGFGGSTIAACAAFFPELVLPLQPEAMVFFAGDNDLEHGASPREVHAALAELLDQWQTIAGAEQFAMFALKPSPARLSLFQAIEETNSWCSQEVEGRGGTWIDIFDDMLDEEKRPRPELFMPDRLHLSRAGYALWTAHLRAAVPRFQ